MAAGDAVRPLLLGLTGGLASGKSTVARRLAESGCRVVDADRLVAELYAPGEAGAAAARRLFGDGVFTDDGSLDRGAVARRVFTDPEARRALEREIHPLVRDRFQQIVETAEEDVVVLEATLLVEAGYGSDLDCVVSVEAPFEERLARAVARGHSEEDARARLAAQGDGTERREAADRLIHNTGDLEHLFHQVDELADELQRIAARRREGEEGER